MRRVSQIAASCALMMALAPAYAGAEPPRIETGTGSTFSASSYTMDRGQEVLYGNTGDQPHNVKSFDFSAGRFLFGSSTIQPGDTAPVSGVEYLDSGIYRFFCTLHPGMEADLIVSAEGTPKPRPAVQATLVWDRKVTLVRTGRLKIRLTSPVSVDAVTVRLLRSGKAIWTSSVGLVAGTDKTVTAALPGSVRRQVRKLRSARFSVAGSVQFGTFSGASRSFR